ncbi:MAG TPA: SpoIIE family protein phosphatase [Bacteroidales bacterium]|nr:SpoIIE family protein phosphatase [Bacteroidales bacterium]
MDDSFYIEVFCEQKSHSQERICGDVFVSRRVKEEGRTIVVLSDGMGHGVKANMLATLTSTMALNFTEEHKDVARIAEIIMNTLPVCSERKMSYSTFTIIDIEHHGQTRIMEYDNPQTLILRGGEEFQPNWQCVMLGGDQHSGKEILTCTFRPRKEDRIVFCSDGIPQSGMGSEKFPFGWGRDNMRDYVLKLVSDNPDVSARHLAAKVVNLAHINDGYAPKDDTSCGVVYFREPRRLLLCTGPPIDEANDTVLASTVKEFKGSRILSGATTSDIVAREWKESITDTFEFDDPDLPPVSSMPGIDLITEGILTLTKVTDILRDYNPSYKLGKGPADRIVRMLMESDEIHFLIGTRINEAHQDPSLPLDLEIRRTVVRRIARLLEEKFLKEVDVRFL